MKYAALVLVFALGTAATLNTALVGFARLRRVLKPAASVVVVVPAADENRESLEVLMQRENETAAFRLDR